MTPDQIADLSKKIDSFVELELGAKLPFVCLLLDYQSHRLGMFTNRRSNQEVNDMLRSALDAIASNPDFIPFDS